MSKPKTSQVWIENGYALFAQDGLDGIQVERLSKVVNLNKSGFYHYFGDRESFLEELMKHHILIARALAEEFRKMEQIDPDFFHLLLKYATPTMANMQLVRYRQYPLLNKSFAQVNDLLETALTPKWAEFIGMPDHPELARKYFEQARDMFYSRITPDKMNMEYLTSLIYEVRTLVHQLMGKKPN
jgi:AcrR family transcriptional regulator